MAHKCKVEAVEKNMSEASQNLQKTGPTLDHVTSGESVREEALNVIAKIATNRSAKAKDTMKN